MSTPSKRLASGGRGRASAEEAVPTSSTVAPALSTAQKPSTPAGVARARSTRSGTPVSARAAAVRRDSPDARAEVASALVDLQERLQREEKLSEHRRSNAEVLQAKLDETLHEAAKLEEKLRESDELVMTLRNEKREAARQMREMEAMNEADHSVSLKEKEELANKQQEMQAVIQRLKDSLAQRNNTNDDARLSRQGNSSTPLDSSSNFAPPSSLQTGDSQSGSKLVLQKDKLIESLRLELAEAQIKLVESENRGDGRLQDVERQLMKARRDNARLIEDNESYQLLLQEKTLRGDFSQSDFSYMGASANQDALNALEGKTGGGSSLADELSEATEAESEGHRRLEADLKSMKEQNKALTLYINKIIERLLQHQEFESILDQSGEAKLGGPNLSSDLTAGPGSEQQANSNASLLQRAKSIAVGPSMKPKPRPVSFMPAPANSAHTHPETAPSIPIGNLGRSASTRRTRPQSDQLTGAASLISQMYKGADGPISPSPLGNSRHSQSFFGPPNPSSNSNTAARQPSGSQASSGNFPGMKSETSSTSGDSGDVSISTPPSQSPPRSQSDKQTTFAGGKPRPLRLVRENQDAVKDGQKRASWYSGWSWGAKKDETQPEASIPE